MKEKQLYRDYIGGIGLDGRSIVYTIASEKCLAVAAYIYLFDDDCLGLVFYMFFSFFFLHFDWLTDYLTLVFSSLFCSLTLKS